jgi:hypothetical protein
MQKLRIRLVVARRGHALQNAGQHAIREALVDSFMPDQKTEELRSAEKIQ